MQCLIFRDLTPHHAIAVFRNYCRRWPRNTHYNRRYPFLRPDFHRLDRTSLPRYSVRPRLPIQCHNHTATPIMKANEPGAVDPRSHHEAVRMMGNDTRAIQMAVGIRPPCPNEVHGTSRQHSSSLPREWAVKTTMLLVATMFCAFRSPSQNLTQRFAAVSIHATVMQAYFPTVASTSNVFELAASDEGPDSGWG